MKSYVFRCLHQALLATDNLEVSERTPGKTRKQHILGRQSSSLMNKKYNLRKDPHQCVTRGRMKAPTPPASQRKRDIIGGLNYQMQCAQDQGLGCPIWGETACSDGLGGMPWSLNCTSHKKLTPPSASIATNRGSGKQGSPRLPQQAIG